MTNDDKNEFYFLEYDYLSLCEEMRDNLKYQKELGWACIAAVLAFLGAVLVKNDVIPELCLFPDVHTRSLMKREVKSVLQNHQQRSGADQEAANH